MRTILIPLFMLLFIHAEATVTDSSYYGFTVRQDAIIQAFPDSIYKYFVLDIGKWWDSEHTWSGHAENLIIQPKANGCFCEKLDRGGSVKHMTVVFVEPGKVLRMEGGLGPLQLLAVQGTFTFEIIPTLPTSRVVIIYTVGGYSPTGLGHLAPLVDRMLGDQLRRFKEYADARAKR